MKKTNSIIIIFLISLITACDFYGTYEFRIKNELETPINVSFYNQDSRDSVDLIVLPDSIRTVAKSGSENIGINEELNNIHSDTIWVLNDLKIKLDTIELSKDFQIGAEWDYKLIETQYGIYTLTIDSTDL